MSSGEETGRPISAILSIHLSKCLALTFDRTSPFLSAPQASILTDILSLT